MKLTAEIEGTGYALDVQREGARVLAEVDGRRYELEAREAEPGVFLLQAGGRVYECHVAAATSPAGAAQVHVGQQAFQIALVDPRRLRHTQATGAHTSGRAAVVAAMPGKVVRILTEAGAEVAAGDALLVVEAMKMQNELRSPKAGRVVEVHTTAGATVNAGDVLVVVE